MTPVHDLAVLQQALDQLAELLNGLDRAALSDRTPCEEWTVQDLVDHVVAAPENFARMLRREPIDWSASPSAGEHPTEIFRAHAADLLAAWHDVDDPAQPVSLDWQCAELAVHTWDLATALRVPTDGFDPEVAERGLAFMRASLTHDRRGPAFGPERQAPEEADSYQRIAAFAGRSVNLTPLP